jgi:hypothetical protein
MAAVRDDRGIARPALSVEPFCCIPTNASESRIHGHAGYGHRSKQRITPSKLRPECGQIAEDSNRASLQPMPLRELPSDRNNLGTFSALRRTSSASAQARMRPDMAPLTFQVSKLTTRRPFRFLRHAHSSKRDQSQRSFPDAIQFL